MKSKKTYIEDDLICYHCGDFCKDKSIVINEKIFCSANCKSVYKILEKNNLCKYYDIESNPGFSPSARIDNKYTYLDDEETINRLIDFKNGKISKVSLKIPRIHSNSCVWLLENLCKLNEGIIYSQVILSQQVLTLKYLSEKTNLRNIVELLDVLGYEPLIVLKTRGKKSKNRFDNKLFYKAGISGITVISFLLLKLSGYTLQDKIFSPGYNILAGYLILLISLPVFIYCSSDYFISSYKDLIRRKLNINIPITLGIFSLLLMSMVEIIFQTGSGYLDTLSVFLFFLLAIRILQIRFFDSDSTGEIIKADSILKVVVLKNGKEYKIPITKLKTGDRLIVRNGDLIPADSILFKGYANIDFSFATGESIPGNKVLGEIIQAGGRQCGDEIELEVINDVPLDYLTKLRNNDTILKNSKENNFSDLNISLKYFVPAILILAAISEAIWFKVNSAIALKVFVTILIVAYPFSAVFAIPLTIANIKKIFQRNNFFIKNIAVIKNLSRINTIVFDKTGTITINGISEIEFIGSDLNNFECSLVKSLARNSAHPLSRAIYQFLYNYEEYNIKSFSEENGSGISGTILDNYVRLGSAKFISDCSTLTDSKEKHNSSEVFVSINDEIKGYFNLTNSYRNGLKNLTDKLGKKYDLHLLTGDNENEKNSLRDYFKCEENLHFNQNPLNKQNYIKSLQNSGKKVLMVGDGLNDADALKQSDASISVSDDLNNYYPTCDATLYSENFDLLNDFIALSSNCMKLIVVTTVLSIIYNTLCVSLAVTGSISLFAAAILMPVNSIFVMLFCKVAVNFLSKKRNL